METKINPIIVTKPTVLLADGRRNVVDLQKLQFIEAKGRYKNFYFSDREQPYKVDTTMKIIMDTLMNMTNFYCVHRSFVVNMAFVHSYDDHNVYVEHFGSEYIIPVTNNDMVGYFHEVFKD